jgi:Arc/MetJ-type ribon-helix-helix transcriptional regulator
MKHRVQVTLDESTFRYLRSLVDSEEAASLSHAIRRIVKEYRRLLRAREGVAP